MIDALATALGVTAEFLRRAGRVRGAMAVDVHMRRRATAKATVWPVGSSTKRLSDARSAAERGGHDPSGAGNSAFRSDRSPCGRCGAHGPHAVADAHRTSSGVGALAEAAGCLVIMQDFGSSRVDGMSQWVDDLPVMLVNARTRPIGCDSRSLTNSGICACIRWRSLTPSKTRPTRSLRSS